MSQSSTLPYLAEWTAADRAQLRLFVEGGAWSTPDDGPHRSQSVEAARLVLRDLAHQGWVLAGSADGFDATPPGLEMGASDEKLRVQRQERWKRDEQLRQPSVRRFVAEMEAPREHRGRFVSVFNLMRDGEELSAALVGAGQNGPLPVEPYVQYPGPRDRCEFTGLRLLDVWRYFRHTWSNQYLSTPGRSMPILVRDRAAADHPVVGIASLGSAIVQIAERDRYIGWDQQTVIGRMTERPTEQDAHWLVSQIEHWRGELYLVDLAADGLYSESFWEVLPDGVVDKLRAEAAVRRRRHQRLARKTDFRWSRGTLDEDAWAHRAVTDLFRSKRCALLADLLSTNAEIRRGMAVPTAEALGAALNSPSFRRAVAWVVRRSKAESVGTALADITVCGAVAPYTHLLGGKLLSVLAASPSTVRAYRERYSSRPSEIASSMAGRPIAREAHLAFLGTTSLYGAGSSQYNRISVPPEVLAGTRPLQFVQLGRSRAYGTSHLADDTVSALARLAEQSHDGARVKSIFGEGASPKLRRVREGLDRLGWPSDALLRHWRERIVYGVPITSNPHGYLLRREEKPAYIYDLELPDDVDRLAAWWKERWLRRRLENPEVVSQVRGHSTARPVAHGARVSLPEVLTADLEDLGECGQGDN